MLSCLTLAFAALLHDPSDSADDPNVCRCAVVRATDGWCAKCGVGYYASQRIALQKIFEVLDITGHEVFADRTACPTCRSIILHGGFCDACNMGFIHGRGFFTRLCYHMARGRPVPPAATQSACCPSDGAWCMKCRTGRIGNRVFLDQSEFEAARKYYAVFTSALREASRCETCAIAMIANSRCHLCRLEYKDGARVEAPAHPASSKPAAKSDIK